MQMSLMTPLSRRASAETPSRRGARSLRWLSAALVLGMVAAGCRGDTGDQASPIGASTAVSGQPTTAPTTQPNVSATPRQVPSPTAGTGAGSVAASPASSASPAADRPAPTAAPAARSRPVAELKIESFAVPAGSGPHDVAPAPDGTVWYTGQRSGELGRLDPRTGEVKRIPLGQGSAPHGVIVGPDGAAWVTDGGLNAIVRVDQNTHEVTRYPLPANRAGANLNTATFDGRGVLWFTGQSGFYGQLNPATGKMEVYDAPRGRGPYGIATAPDGSVYYASLAGSHIAKIDIETGAATVIEPPTARQGARRVWSDPQGRIWVSEWNAGQVGVYDPQSGQWKEWRLPGANPMAYAVYVDAEGIVWLSDFGANAMVRFDPASEEFTSLPLPSPQGSVRQILGVPGQVWGAESSADKLILIRTRQEQAGP